MPFKVVQLVSYLFQMSRGLVFGSCLRWHVFIVRCDHFDELGLVSEFVILGFGLLLPILVPKFLELLLLCVYLRLQLILLSLVILHQGFTHLLTVPIYFLHLELLVFLYLTDLTSQLIYLLLLVFCVFGLILFQFQQVSLAIDPGFL